MARRRHRFVRPAPKTKMWIGTGVGRASVSGTTPLLLASLNATALALRPFTILRSRILFYAESDQIIATETNSGVYSRQVVTDSAIAAGVGSVPTPLSQFEADYYVYQPFQYDFLFSTASGHQTQFAYQYMIDSKAMRKVGPDDDIAIVVEQRGVVGATVGTEGRALIQLH